MIVVLLFVFFSFIRNLQFALERIVFCQKYSAVESKLIIKKSSHSYTLFKK